MGLWAKGCIEHPTHSDGHFRMYARAIPERNFPLPLSEFYPTDYERSAGGASPQCHPPPSFAMGLILVEEEGHTCCACPAHRRFDDNETRGFCVSAPSHDLDR